MIERVEITRVADRLVMRESNMSMYVHSLPAGCGNSRKRLIHLTSTEQRLEVIMAVTTMSDPLDRMWMALSIIIPTPPVEPTSSSSTVSKYFSKERPAPALEEGGERERESEIASGSQIICGKSLFEYHHPYYTYQFY